MGREEKQKASYQFLSAAEQKWLEADSIDYHSLVRTLRASTKDIRKYREEIKKITKNLSYKNSHFLVLGLEEILTNVMEHGYRYDGRRKIYTGFFYTKKRAIIKIADRAKPYDPTKAKHPEPMELLEKGADGGYGNYLVKKIFYKAVYRQLSNGNLLVLFYID
ncbi:MAG: ATP-binding protein [Candidatus Hydrogenedentota bacterium]|nr:MAG: ATP-binding protein [Candidatus Hydrogenedentota bacterium]